MQSTRFPAKWLCRSAPVLLAATLAGCAAGEPTTASVGGDCLSVRLARDFRMLDAQNLIVRAPQPYHLELSPGCGELPARYRVGLSARGDRLCGFAGDAVILDTGAFPERCPVLRVERLDEASVQELIWRFEGFEPREGDAEPDVDDESAVDDDPRSPPAR